MRRTISWATMALLATACSTSGSGSTSTSGSSGGSSTTSSNSSGTTTGSGSGTSTGGGSSTGGAASSTGGSSTGGTTTGGNICGIALDAGVIAICGNTFIPENLEVNIGDTIIFINGDGITHRPTSTDVAGDFDTHHLRKSDGGWTFDTGFLDTTLDGGNNHVAVWVPTDAGVEHGAVQYYYCQFHGVHMSGNPSPTITVK